MNKFLAILLVISLAGCVAIRPTPPQEIIITVKAVDPTKVTVSKGKDHIIRSMEVSNPQGGLSGMTFISKGQAFMTIWSGLGISDVKNLWNDFVYLENSTDIRTVNIFLNSSGGSAFAGLALADQIESAKRKGFYMTAHASGVVASAAVPVLAVCDCRLATPGTIFMVHEASLWQWPGRETASAIRSQNELMQLLRERYLEKMAANTKLQKYEWEKMESRTTWFSVEKALKWGLVDKIE